MAVTSSPRAGFSFRKEVRCVVTSLFRACPRRGGGGKGVASRRKLGAWLEAAHARSERGGGGAREAVRGGGPYRDPIEILWGAYGTLRRELWRNPYGVL